MENNNANNQNKKQTMETQNKEKLIKQMLEIEKVEELRKKMFKAPNKDEIDEIVEKDLLEPPLAEIYKRLSKAKNEKELDKLIFEGIQNGSIKKEDWYSKEAIEKMQETTKNISKQLENGLTR